jgi:hypothetical protein
MYTKINMFLDKFLWPFFPSHTEKMLIKPIDPLQIQKDKFVNELIIDPLQIQKDKFIDELIIDITNNPNTWTSIRFDMMNDCIYKGDMIVYKTGTIFQPIYISLSKEQENIIQPLIKKVYDNDYSKFFVDKHFKK